jgi:RND family efflux transporter MFP subunit
MTINKRFKHTALAISIIALGLITLVFLKLTAPLVLAKPVAERVWPVATQLIKVSSFRPELKEYGTVIAGNQAELRPQVSGRIVQIGENYYEGAIITKGDLLAKIDPFDYQIKLEDSKAALDEVLNRIAETEGEIKYETQLLKITRAQVVIRKRDLERRRKLSKRGSSSQKSLDDAEISYNNAAKDVAMRQQINLRLRNRLNQQKASGVRARSALKSAKRNVQETTIMAPFDGFLANADVSVGQRVFTNERLARLIETKRLEVKFRLSESKFSNLIKAPQTTSKNNFSNSELIGKEVKIKWNMGNQTFNYKATIQRLGAEIDVKGGGIDVYARLSNIGLNTSLRPGAFVEVIVRSRIFKNVAKIPDTAVVQSNIVYLIEKGRVKEVTIKQVQRGKNYILIRGNGLDGQRVITRPFPKIANGLLVESK